MTSVGTWSERAVSFLQRLGLGLKRRSFGRSAIGRFLVDALLLPADVQTIRSGYHKEFGCYPRLLRPRTFNEYIQYTKLFRRKPQWTRLADKLCVRDYIEEKIGAQYLHRLFWSGQDLRDVNPDDLPDAFVIKPNHASGQVILVRDKSRLDWEDAIRKTASWMRSDYSINCAEWQYRWIPRRIMIEELLLDEQGEIPVDYKFFCVKGRAVFLNVDFERFQGHKRNLYDRGFHLLPVRYGFPLYDGDVKAPPCLEEMLRLAEFLSADEPFLRVDFYDLGHPVFGELTFQPGGGFDKFEPELFDEKLGDLILGRAPVSNVGTLIEQSAVMTAG